MEILGEEGEDEQERAVQSNERKKKEKRGTS
jgi:hypothetical protein